MATDMMVPPAPSDPEALAAHLARVAELEEGLESRVRDLTANLEQLERLSATSGRHLASATAEKLRDDAARDFDTMRPWRDSRKETRRDTADWQSVSEKARDQLLEATQRRRGLEREVAAAPQAAGNHRKRAARTPLVGQALRKNRRRGRGEANEVPDPAAPLPIPSYPGPPTKPGRAVPAGPRAGARPPMTPLPPPMARDHRRGKVQVGHSLPPELRGLRPKKLDLTHPKSPKRRRGPRPGPTGPSRKAVERLVDARVATTTEGVVASVLQLKDAVGRLASDAARRPRAPVATPAPPPAPAVLVQSNDHLAAAVRDLASQAQAAARAAEVAQQVATEAVESGGLHDAVPDEPAYRVMLTTPAKAALVKQLRTAAATPLFPASSAAGAQQDGGDPTRYEDLPWDETLVIPDVSAVPSWSGAPSLAGSGVARKVHASQVSAPLVRSGSSQREYPGAPPVLRPVLFATANDHGPEPLRAGDETDAYSKPVESPPRMEFIGIGDVTGGPVSRTMRGGLREAPPAVPAASEGGDCSAGNAEAAAGPFPSLAPPVASPIPLPADMMAAPRDAVRVHMSRATDQSMLGTLQQLHRALHFGPPSPLSTPAFPSLPDAQDLVDVPPEVRRRDQQLEMAQVVTAAVTAAMAPTLEATQASNARLLDTLERLVLREAGAPAVPTFHKVPVREAPPPYPQLGAGGGEDAGRIMVAPAGSGLTSEADGESDASGLGAFDLDGNASSQSSFDLARGAADLAMPSPRESVEELEDDRASTAQVEETFQTSFGAMLGEGRWTAHGPSAPGTSHAVSVGFGPSTRAPGATSELRKAVPEDLHEAKGQGLGAKTSLGALLGRGRFTPYSEDPKEATTAPAAFAFRGRDAAPESLVKHDLRRKVEELRKGACARSARGQEKEKALPEDLRQGFEDLEYLEGGEEGPGTRVAGARAGAGAAGRPAADSEWGMRKVVDGLEVELEATEGAPLAPSVRPSEGLRTELARLAERVDAVERRGADAANASSALAPEDAVMIAADALEDGLGSREFTKLEWATLLRLARAHGGAYGLASAFESRDPRDTGFVGRLDFIRGLKELGLAADLSEGALEHICFLANPNLEDNFVNYEDFLRLLHQGIFVDVQGPEREAAPLDVTALKERMRARAKELGLESAEPEGPEEGAAHRDAATKAEQGEICATSESEEDPVAALRAVEAALEEGQRPAGWQPEATASSLESGEIRGAPFEFDEGEVLLGHAPSKFPAAEHPCARNSTPAEPWQALPTFPGKHALAQPARSSPCRRLSSEQRSPLSSLTMASHRGKAAPLVDAVFARCPKDDLGCVSAEELLATLKATEPDQLRRLGMDPALVYGRNPAAASFQAAFVDMGAGDDTEGIRNRVTAEEFRDFCETLQELRRGAVEGFRVSPPPREKLLSWSDGEGSHTSEEDDFEDATGAAGASEAPTTRQEIPSLSDSESDDVSSDTSGDAGPAPRHLALRSSRNFEERPQRGRHVTRKKQPVALQPAAKKLAEEAFPLPSFPLSFAAEGGDPSEQKDGTDEWERVKGRMGFGIM